MNLLYPLPARAANYHATTPATAGANTRSPLMGFVNKVMLLGNTTRDPNLRQLPSGTAVCDFGLATNRVYKTTNGEERQETVFIDCTAFGKVGETIAQYCPKGRPLF